MGYGYNVADGARTIMGEPYDGLEPYGEYESEGEAYWDYRAAWDDWKADALSCLSGNWQHVQDGPWRTGHPSGQVIAESGLHELLIEECRGGYGYAFLSVVPRSDLDADGWGYNGYDHTISARHRLAIATLDRTADAIFRKLAAMHEIQTPGGYTSSPYKAA